MLQKEDIGQMDGVLVVTRMETRRIQNVTFHIYCDVL